jgi:hypothetical protein
MLTVFIAFIVLVMGLKLFKVATKVICFIVLLLAALTAVAYFL